MAEAPKILLVGWEGTLAPDLAWPQRTPVPERLVEVTRPLLREAAATFGSMLERSGLRFTGEAASPESPGSGPLNSALGGRLLGVYALPVSLRQLEAGSGARVRADRMARLLVDDWIEGMASFVRRLRADSGSLARWMGDGELGPIERIGPTASDVHGPAGGVIAIGFEGGRRIFYKPRPVTGEMLWAELQAAVARVDKASALPAASVLVGGASSGRRGAKRGGSPGFGWMSELRRGTCEAEAYWHRAGALLCLAQHVGLGDLHMGNVLATEQGPAVLDAECLGGAGVAGPSSADGLTEALLATGLLPVATEGIPDVSGLFGSPGPAHGVLVPSWEQAPDGHPVLRFAGARLLEQGNRGEARDEPLRSLPGMLAGYSGAMGVLREIRSDLLGAGGWAERLGAFHPPRVVLRSTLTYGVLISRMLLEDGDREDDSRGRVREWLMQSSAPGAEVGRQPGILEAEVDALLRMRVPRFHLAAGGCGLRSEAGRIVARDVGSATPGELVGERLRSISSGANEAEVGDALAGILFRGRRKDS